MLIAALVLGAVATFIFAVVAGYNLFIWYYMWADMIAFNWRILLMGTKGYMVWLKQRKYR